MTSGYLTRPLRTEEQARRDMGRMPNHIFYAKLVVADEFERLATEIKSENLISDASRIARVLDNRASRLRGELQREADRQARADSDDED